MSNLDKIFMIMNTEKKEIFFPIIDFNRVDLNKYELNNEGKILSFHYKNGINGNNFYFVGKLLENKIDKNEIDYIIENLKWEIEDRRIFYKKNEKYEFNLILLNNFKFTENGKNFLRTIEENIKRINQ